MVPLELLWADVAKRRMTALSVVPDLDPPEDRLAGFISGLERMSMHEFSLEAREEALDRRVVPAIALGARTVCNTGISTLPLVIVAGVLPPTVAVTDHMDFIRLDGLALQERRRERGDHQRTVDVLIHT